MLYANAIYQTSMEGAEKKSNETANATKIKQESARSPKSFFFSK